MAQPTDVDWPREIRVLRQLLPMATTVHVVATEALLRQFTKLRQKPGYEQKTKVLAFKLIAEAMSALEDFGALCRAVRLRGNGGIIWNYREYRPGAISKVYKAIQKEGFGWNYLRLYAPAEYVNNPDADNPNLLMDLNLIINSTAKWQQASGMIDVYNRAKHGFTVLAAPPEEENSTPRAGDSDTTIYVLSNVRADGQPEYLRLQKFSEWPEKAKMVVETCADGWRQLAELVIFMHEHGDLAAEPPEVSDAGTREGH